MRWHRSDEVPENGTLCLCKFKWGPEDTDLRVLKAYVYRDSSGEVKTYVWYDTVEGEFYGEWKPWEILYWCPLDEIDAALTAINGETSGED